MITAIDLSADVGLVAVGLVTLNLLLGLMMALRYSPVRYWPHRHFNYFRHAQLDGLLAARNFDFASGDSAIFFDGEIPVAGYRVSGAFAQPAAG